MRYLSRKCYSVDCTGYDPVPMFPNSLDKKLWYNNRVTINQQCYNYRSQIGSYLVVQLGDYCWNVLIHDH